ncbi:MAG: ATP-binding cassette domain-containing protein [Firmicutes bacterium]|nr:ATP-binding cassette domain-containing protein [Bacillota bacterium]
MIEAKNVSLQYPDGTLALRKINLSVKMREIVYITGPSGSGKTSLLKLLMGIEFPTAGTLKVLGQTLNEREMKKIRWLRTLMGPVFQDFRLVKGRTALENVMLGMRFLDLSLEEMKSRAQEALFKVGLEHKADALVENLSWGEGQRVSIARAVARKPAIILADEPTGNLDKENAQNILELLAAASRECNAAVIITTHATHLIDESKGRIIRLRKGSMERADA